MPPPTRGTRRPAAGKGARTAGARVARGTTAPGSSAPVAEEEQTSRADAARHELRVVPRHEPLRDAEFATQVSIRLAQTASLLRRAFALHL